LPPWGGRLTTGIYPSSPPQKLRKEPGKKEKKGDSVLFPMPSTQQKEEGIPAEKGSLDLRSGGVCSIQEPAAIALWCSAKSSEICLLGSARRRWKGGLEGGFCREGRGASLSSRGGRDEHGASHRSPKITGLRLYRPRRTSTI